MLSNRYPLTFRAAGIALHEGRVLIHTGDGDDFWTLPGGRVEALESAAQALAREMREELNAEARVGRLRFVLENLFTYRGVTYHEIGLYFALHFPKHSPILMQTGPFVGVEGHMTLTFEWVPLAELPARPVLPDILCAEIGQRRRGIRYHFINDVGRDG